MSRVVALNAGPLGLPTADFILATTNVRHLSQFVPGAFWTDISP